MENGHFEVRRRREDHSRMDFGKIKLRGWKGDGSFSGSYLIVDFCISGVEFLSPAVREFDAYLIKNDIYGMSNMFAIKCQKQKISDVENGIKPIVTNFLKFHKNRIGIRKYSLSL